MNSSPSESAKRTAVRAPELLMLGAERLDRRSRKRLIDRVLALPVVSAAQPAWTRTLRQAAGLFTDRSTSRRMSGRRV